jgi:hypothetical protein
MSYKIMNSGYKHINYELRTLNFCKIKKAVPILAGQLTVIIY